MEDEALSRCVVGGCDEMLTMRMSGPDTSRRAAVLVPLCTYRNQPAILYTLRSHVSTRYLAPRNDPSRRSDELAQPLIVA